MQYQVELKPFQKQDGISYKILTISDLSLHTAKKQPSAIGKRLKESVQSSLPTRIYFPIAPSEGTLSKESLINLLKSDPDIISMIQEEEKKGFKVLLEIPKGIPLLAGKDTEEFVNSIKGKRTLRMLDKKKRTS